MADTKIMIDFIYLTAAKLNNCTIITILDIANSTWQNNWRGKIHFCKIYKKLKTSFKILPTFKLRYPIFTVINDGTESIYAASAFQKNI